MDIARRVSGVSKSKVNNWFTGTAIPDISEGLQLSRLFSVPVDYLADDALDDPPPPSLTPEESELIRVASLVQGGIPEAIRRIVNPASPPAPDIVTSPALAPVVIAQGSKVQSPEDRSRKGAG